jgi:hypothetical protein
MPQPLSGTGNPNLAAPGPPSGYLGTAPPISASDEISPVSSPPRLLLLARWHHGGVLCFAKSDWGGRAACPHVSPLRGVEIALGRRRPRPTSPTRGMRSAWGTAFGGYLGFSASIKRRGDRFYEHGFSCWQE